MAPVSLWNPRFRNERLIYQLPPGRVVCFSPIIDSGRVPVRDAINQAQAELCGANNEIRLRIVDAGVGFDPALRSGDAGLGLVSMRERLRLVGGRLSVQSAPLRGTEILAIVPLSISANEVQVRVQATGG